MRCPKCLESILKSKFKQHLAECKYPIPTLVNGMYFWNGKPK